MNLHALAASLTSHTPAILATATPIARASLHEVNHFDLDVFGYMDSKGDKHAVVPRYLLKEALFIAKMVSAL